MHQEDVAGGEIRQQIFGAPPEAGYRVSFQALDEISRQRETQILPPRFHLQEARTLHGGLKAAPDRFDLGKFGHLYALSELLSR